MNRGTSLFKAMTQRIISGNILDIERIRPLPKSFSTWYALYMSVSVINGVVDLIGNTPLVPLRVLTSELPDNVRVYVKAEWMNPGGSVKDRAARSIVERAWKQGELKAGGVLLDASSGNTGIAYAMLAAALGFKLKLCLPANANPERKRTLIAYGAELILTDPAEGSDGAIVEAQKLSAANPTWFYADQYNNDANWQAHYKTTGPELVKQTNGKLTHFVGGLGTSGTCMGVGRYLREFLPSADLIAVQPDGPFHGLEGMKHMESAIVPGIYDPAVPHSQRVCSTEAAYETVLAMARQEGLLIGISAGSLVKTAIDIAREEAAAGREALIVALCCDGGDRYLSEHFWEN